MSSNVVDVSTEHVERVAQCLPFADSEAGIPETQAMLRALAEDRDVSRRVVDDLAALVRRLAHSLDKPNGNALLARQAVDYLQRSGLLGSPLR